MLPYYGEAFPVKLVDWLGVAFFSAITWAVKQWRQQNQGVILVNNAQPVATRVALPQARLPPLNSSLQSAALSLRCGSGLVHGWLRQEVILMVMLPNGAG